MQYDNWTKYLWDWTKFLSLFIHFVFPKLSEKFMWAIFQGSYASRDLKDFKCFNTRNFANLYLKSANHSAAECPLVMTSLFFSAILLWHLWDFLTTFAFFKRSFHEIWDFFLRMLDEIDFSWRYLSKFAIFYVRIFGCMNFKIFGTKCLNFSENSASRKSIVNKIGQYLKTF